MKPSTPTPFATSVWVSSVVAATLLAGACVAPEFTKVDELAGAGGVTSSTTLGSGGSGFGGATSDTTGNATSQGTNSTGGSDGSVGGASSGTETA